MSDNASDIVDKMYDNDPFSIWLGIKRIQDAPGQSILQMTVRKEMLNGFGIAHGGITYSLADSALAFASNAHGRQSVSLNTSITHVKAVKEGDVLTTDVREEYLGKSTGVYHISIKNQEGVLVAIFKGTVMRRGEW